jgi:hypothetical protein
MLALAFNACGKSRSDDVPAFDAPAEERAQCMRDDDCVLLPNALTCCIECPPAPPFEPAPSWVLDGMLIENETVCPQRWKCPPIECDPVPPGCIAKAACRGGRCIAVTTGCDRPTS